MKRIIIIAFAWILFISFAVAETEPPVPPNYQEATRQRIPLSIISRSSGMTVTPVFSSHIITGSNVTISANVNGGIPPYQYQFYILSDDDEPSDYLKTYYYSNGYVDNNSFTYTFYKPGKYYIWIDVMDSTGLKCVSHPYPGNCTVTGEDLLQQKIDSIVSDCPSGSEYDKVLYFHDYLTHHAYYDGGYNRYAEDGVLMDGLGVCDSYSRAYRILLNSVGIDAPRVKSEGHAWNAVQMEGNYYHIDVTWDDPVSSAQAVSGAENHIFFGLPTEVIVQVRSHQPVNTFPECNSYEMNYSIFNQDMPWHGELIGNITSKIESGEMNFSLNLSGKYSWREGNLIYTRTMNYPVVYYSLSRYLIERDGALYRDRQMEIGIAYDGQLHMDVNCGYVLNTTGEVFILPPDVTIIDGHALQGTNAVVIIIPEGCTSIGDEAFANMTRLDEVHIPASVVSFGNGIFQGDRENLLVVTPRNSPASTLQQLSKYCILQQ